MKAFEITDTKSGRNYEFDGELLSSESTASPGRSRWSELHIYRTSGGQYILVKKGCSDVYHASRECGRGGRFYTENPVDDFDFDSTQPCSKCRPDPKPDGKVFMENDLVTVVVSRSAAGIVDSAHLTDRDDVVFLTKIGMRVLEKAAKKDEAIREAYVHAVVS